MKKVSIYCIFLEFNFMGELPFEILLLNLQLLLLGKSVPVAARSKA